MPSRLIAVYPGSFDPLTNGHLDLIERGARLADHLIVAILNNSGKLPLFSVAERVAMVKEATVPFSNVAVDSFDGLLVDYAARVNASAILRGIRNVGDYEAELPMAHLNRKLRPGTETMFLLAGPEFSFLSSRMIKEVAALGGDVSAFTPSAVAERLRAKFPNKR
jgi:pantetheine-phosphate adenylyltransferase